MTLRPRQKLHPLRLIESFSVKKVRRVLVNFFPEFLDFIRRDDLLTVFPIKILSNDFLLSPFQISVKRDVELVSKNSQQNNKNK